MGGIREVNRHIRKVFCQFREECPGWVSPARVRAKFSQRRSRHTLQRRDPPGGPRIAVVKTLISRERRHPALSRDRWFESGPLQRRVRLSRGRGLCRSRTPGFSRLSAAAVAARSAETRKVFRYRDNRRQYLCPAPPMRRSLMGIFIYFDGDTRSHRWLLRILCHYPIPASSAPADCGSDAANGRSPR